MGTWGWVSGQSAGLGFGRPGTGAPAAALSKPRSLQTTGKRGLKSAQLPGTAWHSRPGKHSPALTPQRAAPPGASLPRSPARCPCPRALVGPPLQPLAGAAGSRRCGPAAGEEGARLIGLLGCKLPALGVVSPGSCAGRESRQAMRCPSSPNILYRPRSPSPGPTRWPAQHAHPTAPLGTNCRPQAQGLRRAVNSCAGALPSVHSA